MLCEHCKKREATVKYVEVVNGVRTEHNFCTQCASHIDMGHYSALFEGELSLGRLLSGLLAMRDQDAEPETERLSGVVCPSCRTSYEDFVKDSQFGCPDCYSVFGPLIGENIRRLQGSEKHVGKQPKFHKIIVPAVDSGEPDAAAEPENGGGFSGGAGEAAEGSGTAAANGAGRTGNSADGREAGSAGVMAKMAGSEAGSAGSKAGAAGNKINAAGQGNAAAGNLLPPEERIRRLKSRLADAIRVEDYEKAAALRDQIRALKEEIKQDGKVV